MPIDRDSAGRASPYARVVIEDMQGPPPPDVDYSKLREESDVLLQELYAAELGRRSVQQAAETEPQAE